MKQMTPEEEIAQAEDRFLSLLDVIQDLRHQIETLKDEAKAGGELNCAATDKKLSEFNKVVVACTNAERILDECRNKQSGIARGGYALDLDKMRVAIGGKLDRLRRSASSGSVSE